MVRPTHEAWGAAMHAAHYMYHHCNDGMVYKSTRNLEPVAYYDSGFNQGKTLCRWGVFDTPSAPTQAIFLLHARLPRG
jgi:hypothetical protein